MCKRKIFTIVFIAIIIIVSVFFLLFKSMEFNKGELEYKFAILKKSFKNSGYTQKSIYNSMQYHTYENSYIVAFSICNISERVKVFFTIGNSIDEAWNVGKAKVMAFVKENNYDVKWLKVDIVNHMEKIQSHTIAHLIMPYYDEFFRKGISFDDGFEIAFLEAEINGNKLIEYDTDTINLKEINKYLTQNSRKKLDKIGDELILFTCLGFFCDQNNNVYELYSDGLDYGRRIIGNVNDEVALGVIETASQFLSDIVQEDGKFIYGYYPTYDKQIQKYNILRHTGTIWSLINQYRMLGRQGLREKIDNTIQFLEQNIEYKNENVAYVIEHNANEVKLGGNGIAIVTLIDYMEQFKTDEYKQLVIHLGNGILELLDMNTGEYFHVLNYPDYVRKEGYRTIYYDGEATFALVRLYGLTGDKRWLTAAEVAVENFIKKDYVKYRDHWIAYSMNEITKYCPEERYFEFALRNVQENLDAIYNQETSYHTYMELLMSTFELYERIISEGHKVAYLDRFNVNYFVDCIFRRAHHMLNGYFYPEYAMYLKNPQRILGAFFVRHDGYRVRIDDVQHFVGGYYYYYLYFKELLKYK